MSEKVMTTVTGKVLSVNTEPAGNGKVYPKITFQGSGRFNRQVECVPGLEAQVSKLKPGQVVRVEVYTKAREVEIAPPGRTPFKKWSDVIDNAYKLEVVG